MRAKYIWKWLLLMTAWTIRTVTARGCQVPTFQRCEGKDAHCGIALVHRELRLVRVDGQTATDNGQIKVVRELGTVMRGVSRRFDPRSVAELLFITTQEKIQ